MTITKKAIDLVEGDYVDLQEDLYADPDNDPAYEYSYAKVLETGSEKIAGVTRVFVLFEHDGGEVSVVFPAEHTVSMG